jgi:hypothetical protein
LNRVTDAPIEEGRSRYVSLEMVIRERRQHGLKKFAAVNEKTIRSGSILGKEFGVCAKPSRGRNAAALGLEHRWVLLCVI